MKINIVILLIGVIIGTFLSRTTPFSKKEESIQEERVIKDVVTVTKVITRPDGTKEEVITVTDKTKENKTATNTKTVAKSNWHASIGAKTKIDKLQVDIYTVQIEKRILGDLFIGVTGSTDKTVGLTVGMEW